jgi:antirestriction protein ArdC
MERGIPEHEILPRVNVFVYKAWQAKGRQVRKGEKGVRITTWITMGPKKDDPKGKTARRPQSTSVFHVSQTDPITG